MKLKDEEDDNSKRAHLLNYTVEAVYDIYVANM